MAGNPLVIAASVDAEILVQPMRVELDQRVEAFLAESSIEVVSIQPSTLLLLAKRNGVTLPADTVEGVKSWFVYRDFPHFIEVFVTVTRCLKRSEDYELAVHDYGAEMARQNIRYAEVTFSPSPQRFVRQEGRVRTDRM